MVWTTNEENRYQQAAGTTKNADELARERRRIAEAAGYIYRSSR